MTERVKGHAFYEDVIAAPDDKIAEIVGGDLYLSPRPSLRHSNATSVLGSNLNEAFHQGRSGPGGWWILDEPEVYILGDVLVADIAGWRRERLSELPEGSGINVTPDWVCEVLSPSTERFDRRQKLPLYALAGVPHLWLVDPAARRLTVFGRVDIQWVPVEEHTGDAVVCAPPFEAVPIELGRLWA